jgi:hypothetical protein
MQKCACYLVLIVEPANLHENSHLYKRGYVFIGAKHKIITLTGYFAPAFAGGEAH